MLSPQTLSSTHVASSQLREVTLLSETRVHPRQHYALFRIAPFAHGQALTFATVTFRMLLFEIGGLALTDLILHSPTNILHEFSPLPGFQQTLPFVLQNLRQVVFRLRREAGAGIEPPVVFSPQERNLGPGLLPVSLDVAGERHVTAGDLQLPPHVEVVDPTQTIAHMCSPNARLKLTAQLAYWKGYMGSPEPLNARFAPAAGEAETPVCIPLQPLFSPVTKANYHITSEGDYESILLEVYTDGSLSPSEALGEASVGLKQLLQPLV